MSDDEIERRALALREALHINHQLNPDLITCIFKAKAAGFLKGYLKSPELAEDASFDPVTGILAIRDDVFEAANHGMPRARFTVAHELGHVTLRHARKRFRGPLAHQKQEMVRTIRGDEVQADKFAAAFLTPYHLANMSADITSQELAERFNVSVGCAEARLDPLHRLHRIKNGIKRPLPDAVVQFMNSTAPRR
nr:MULTISPECIES: ImmA/IrrE family metallo-endopeptidase [unclassified Xanthobacter]